MSGFVQDEFIRVKLLDSYSGFLPKPLHRDELLVAVRQVMMGRQTASPQRAMAAGAMPPCS